MLASLIPLFDENMSVKAYSLFSHKTNMFANPGLLGTGMRDGSGQINELEVIESMGIDTISEDKEIIVPLNALSMYTDVKEQCKDAPAERIVLLLDKDFKPEEMHVNRIKELKSQGFKIAMRRLKVSDFEPYKPVLSLVDYALLDNKKIDISKAKVYFSKVYPNINLIAANVTDKNTFDELSKSGGYKLYEGEFYRLPVTKGQTEIAPLKMNYIELLNLVNDPEFDLTKAADIIGRDTALVVKLLELVNKMALNSEITSIRHAAAMLGQRELKKWINTAVTSQLCTDKPNEITRVSLIRAKFAENLAPVFGIQGQAPELFILGLFSVLDIILEVPMAEALKKIKVSKQVEKALIERKGELSDVLSIIENYENANFAELDRVFILENIKDDDVYNAYKDALSWYRDLFRN